ncbi:CpsD/CapB family tyrosine-protein kinase [Eubacterium sp. ER2]|uniref:CpsD/CapB family tyrosine-protein kinase n=1 Tax=Eubacterium sp. ER2 TaxID=1519438 RepID=UPI00051B13EA|nr:CpsD/CapB family tyrosine-protein kinase [Eubacterium sp. ER2]
MKIKLALKQLDYFSDEAYKKLRTNIQLCGGNKKVIAFTSSIPNEGKSSVSLNLALSMAEAGKGTLFIDADLRKSVLKARVRVKDKVDGLTNYLTEQAEIKEIIYSTEFPELDIIFSGPVPPNPAELLGGEMFQELVHQVRKEYDYVIIDTPPLGSVIDCAVIAKECDGAVLVIESDKISYKFAQEVKEQLEKTGCPILGAILNKVDMTQNKYYVQYKEYQHKVSRK